MDRLPPETVILDKSMATAEPTTTTGLRRVAARVS
jgi:hypothetical protein